jgi:hypothetical protein
MRKSKGDRSPPRANWRSTRPFYFLYRIDGTIGYTIYLRRIERIPVVPVERPDRLYIRYDGYLYPLYDALELHTLVKDAKAGKFMMVGPNMEDCSREEFEHLPFIREGEQYRMYYRW